MPLGRLLDESRSRNKDQLPIGCSLEEEGDGGNFLVKYLQDANLKKKGFELQFGSFLLVPITFLIADGKKRGQVFILDIYFPTSYANLNHLQ